MKLTIQLDPATCCRCRIHGWLPSESAAQREVGAGAPGQHLQSCADLAAALVVEPAQIYSW